MKKIGSALLIGLILLFIILAYNYISYRTKNAVSDAAFIKTDSLLTLGFKVGGKVVKLTKKEGESVHKGELLAHIDTKDFLVAKKKIEDQIAALRHKKEALAIQKNQKNSALDIQEQMTKNNKVKLQESIEAMREAIEALQVQLEQIKKDEKRVAALFRKKLVQKEKLEKLQTKKLSLAHTIAAKQAQVLAMQIDLKNLDEKLRLLEVQKRGLKAMQQQIFALAKQIGALKKAKEEIQNKISYASLHSPINGVVAKRFIAPDRVVKKGSPIYAVVNPKDIHVEVLLSEKKLEGVHPGSPVRITVDAYPDRKYHGKVSKILPASAATFALVPRDIASGEFTKLDQRFVVRITIDNPTPDLRVGMGAGVAIAKE